MKPVRSLAHFVFVVTLLAGISPAFAQSGWEANRGNCESVLQTPEFYTLDEVRSCAQRWESYRNDVSDLAQNEKDRYARGFSRLYYQGSGSDQSVAESALRRMGMSVLPEGDFIPDNRLEEFLARSRPTIGYSPATGRSRNRAEDDNGDGMEHYRDGDYTRAINEFRDALEDDPFYHLAKYNLACNLALTGRHDEALLQLDELSRWDTPLADQQIATARGDSDWASLRDDPRFKFITNTLNTQLLNAGGAAGEGMIDQLQNGLVDEGFVITIVGVDRHTRVKTHIWYAPGFNQQAELAARIAGGNAETHVIDWDTELELIVSYGNPDAASGTELPSPIVQGDLNGRLISGNSPEDAVDDTEDALEDAQDVMEDPQGEAEDFETWMPGGD